jgi:large subunit ribosomal protein L32
MAVPKRRTSKTRRNKRRSHDALNAPGMHRCGHCRAVVRPHMVCPECGHYKGRRVIEK